MRLLAFLLSGILFCIPAHADDWMTPTTRIFASETGEQAIKVVPILKGKNEGKSTATILTLNADGSERPQRELQLLNIPVRVLMPAARVEYFVTLDTWGAAGSAHVVVIYDFNGRVLCDLKMKDLLTEDEQEKHVPRSVSSIWWQEKATFSFATPSTHEGILFTSHPEQTRLNISFDWGKKISIELATGKIESAA